MAVRSRSRVALVVGLAVMAASVAVFGTGALAQSNGQGQPADKVVAGGSILESTGPNEAPIALLSQRMRVSSPADLILQVTAECSILTGLVTGEEGEASDNASAESKVELWITIDGKAVPVQTVPVDEEEGQTRGHEERAVFCNREYQRSVTDREEPEDGTDEERDFIATRHANAFNWFALDTGFAYDNPSNGQNILDVVLWAQFTRNPNTPCTENEDEAFPATTCAEAFVGNRTLIIEPTHAAVGEEVEPFTAPTEAPEDNG